MLNLVSHGLRNFIDSRESNETYLWHILRNMIDHRSYAVVKLKSEKNWFRPERDHLRLTFVIGLNLRFWEQSVCTLTHLWAVQSVCTYPIKHAVGNNVVCNCWSKIKCRDQHFQNAQAICWTWYRRGLSNFIEKARWHSRESNKTYLWHLLRNMIDHRGYAHNLSNCEI